MHAHHSPGASVSQFAGSGCSVQAIRRISELSPTSRAQAGTSSPRPFIFFTSLKGSAILRALQLSAMMAVRSPLSVLSYRDASSSSLESPSAPFGVRDSSYSAPGSEFINAADTLSVAPNDSSDVGAEVEASQDNGDGVGNEITSTTSVHTPGLTIQTTPARVDHVNHARSDEDEPPQSVIHAPPGFGDFVRTSPLVFAPDDFPQSIGTVQA
ncbi:hypothetical protein N7532_002438 [Penicillium argentinense]|uniref:Uncharacterized protein n=1 Tax=Penicillium argentinense TaxID=1131581 RepID=A0A9W9G0F4_9EURO|nr:uncharacterized protein N7532_002438 [Penicillium argentinense]KAJ5109793.1 hypothetical protein N7532_002438 [Penicillium argentinense]